MGLGALSPFLRTRAAPEYLQTEECQGMEPTHA